ncbi:hypothetical protein EYF80_015550 [Liparis tanakae]|uniref:Uncharacterized protein n=1 Tax=Liparis tanakae TaxID=230148 RepID=A0A4Z2I8I7_9TELE|nr:hypothetical protein EYF80_015550 [Liparis tanakae]
MQGAAGAKDVHNASGVLVPRRAVAEHRSEGPELHGLVHVHDGHGPGAVGDGVIHQLLLDTDEGSATRGQQPASSGPLGVFQGAVAGAGPQVGPVSIVAEFANIEAGGAHQQLSAREGAASGPLGVLLMRVHYKEVVELGRGGRQDQDDVRTVGVLQKADRMLFCGGWGRRHSDYRRGRFRWQEGRLKERPLNISEVCVAQVQLTANQDDRSTGAEVLDLRSTLRNSRSNS